jgi:hypothetical protein
MSDTRTVTPHDRFWARVEPDENGCLLWTGHTGRGYGRFTVSHLDTVAAHRYAYEEVRGTIPDGLTLDHLCRVRRCVNPDHMEAVSMRENILRGTSGSAINAKRTHCVHGHPLDEQNTALITRRSSGRVRRVCIICRARRLRERVR